MKYNPVKSMCMLFTRKQLNTFPVTLNGQQLVWCKHAKHLGNYVSWDLSEAKEIANKRSDLVGRVNTVLGNLNGVPLQAVLKVFRSKCCHYYGSMTWQYDLGCLKDFSTMWNK